MHLNENNIRMLINSQDDKINKIITDIETKLTT